jgi:Tfp pilus tip-associated adhesin PilY1
VFTQPTRSSLGLLLARFARPSTSRPTGRLGVSFITAEFFSRRRKGRGELQAAYFLPDGTTSTGISSPIEADEKVGDDIGRDLGWFGGGEKQRRDRRLRRP